ARIVIPSPIGLDIHRAQLPLPDRIVDPGPEPSLLLVHPYLEPEFDQDDAAVHNIFFDLRAERQEAPVLIGRAKAHDIFDAGAVVPAAIEDDDFSSGGEMLHVALQEHLRLLPIRRSGKRDDSEYTRTYLFGDRFDRAALTRSIPAFKQDDDPELLFLHPFLEMAQLGLELAQF